MKLESGVRMHPDGCLKTKRGEIRHRPEIDREWCDRSRAFSGEARSLDFRPQGCLDGWAEGAASCARDRYREAKTRVGLGGAKQSRARRGGKPRAPSRVGSSGNGLKG